ncbi:hypothetical protein JQ506_22975 [Shinella sp. PSBB067]|uniref:hypothetical protein n=1 Tax=Shinella sp. PSBB067 TaxID=2715959 RepID=UPI00193BE540|nr:hypothetical protein [Shinella sp. PSBB067]QRI63625.1 hypothetical protein JQ506_22975 [Shinella sp. PSBB067]
MAQPTLQYRINLLGDGSVVTADGEYLGTWDTDETDAFYQFFPDGEAKPLFDEAFRGILCGKIHAWHTGTPFTETSM